MLVKVAGQFYGGRHSATKQHCKGNWMLKGLQIELPQNLAIASHKSNVFSNQNKRATSFAWMRNDHNRFWGQICIYRWFLLELLKMFWDCRQLVGWRSKLQTTRLVWFVQNIPWSNTTWPNRINQLLCDFTSFLKNHSFSHAWELPTLLM